MSLPNLIMPPPNKTNLPTDLAAEYYLCRSNPLYFIQNYCYFEEMGSISKYDNTKMHPKMRRVIKSVMKFHNVTLMASRQLGKALHISTPILTANGEWTTMGEIKIGDNMLGTIVGIEEDTILLKISIDLNQFQSLWMVR